MFEIAELKSTLSEKNYNEIIELLQDVSNYTPGLESKRSIIKNFIKLKNNHGIMAIDSGTVVAFGSISIDMNIRGGFIGRIEDIVTHKSYRKLGISAQILNRLVEIAQISNCYKIVLECRTDLIKFYEKNGFQQKNIIMRKAL